MNAKLLNRLVLAGVSALVLSMPNSGCISHRPPANAFEAKVDQCSTDGIARIPRVRQSW
jgi:hypothetical protein